MKLPEKLDIVRNGKVFFVFMNLTLFHTEGELLRYDLPDSEDLFNKLVLNDVYELSYYI